MKKTEFVLFFTLLFSLPGLSQSVAINADGSLPNNSAMLDIKSSTKGILIPRTSTVTRLTIPGAKGLMVYDTVTTSFWFHDGSSWTEISQTKNGWGVNGNGSTDPSINFLGTTDGQPIRFRLNNAWAGELNRNTGNYAIGLSALQNSTTGHNNVAVGHFALISNTGGHENTAIGYNAGYYNTTSYLVAVGSYSGANNTSGTLNTFIGTSSGRTNSTGDNNTFLGINTGYASNADGNTFIGTETGKANTSGNYNSIVGSNAFLSNTNGGNNSALGKEALFANIGGGGNTAIGAAALHANTTGGENTAMGYQAAYNNNTDYMVSIGSYSGYSNTSGTWNTFIGTSSGRNNSLGDNNTMVGLNSGQLSNGNNNTFIGTLSGNTNQIGSNNVALGYNAQIGAAFSNAIAIGANASVTQSNSLALGGTGGNAVFVGIGTTAPETTLEVNGFTMLGSSSPKIQMKKLTGISPSFEGGSVLIPHGLNSTKILSVSVMILNTPGSYAPESYSSTAFGNLEFYYLVTSTDIYISTHSTNSSQILSKPLKIFIIYEQ